MRLLAAPLALGMLLSLAGKQATAKGDEAPARGKAAANLVELTIDEQARRVDVTVDGRPFTSYRWDPALKKPLLFPIRAASGGLITRGFPVEPRPDEATDHPHHLGLWLNYGNVDGV